MTDTKRCSTCKEWKPLDSYTKNGKNKDGKQYYCRGCANHGRKAIYKKVGLMKLGAGCAHCGYNAHSHALHYDHIDPANKLNCVSALIRLGAKWSIIEKEMAKCQVLCSNCHAVKTHPRCHSA